MKLLDINFMMDYWNTQNYKKSLKIGFVFLFLTVIQSSFSETSQSSKESEKKGLALPEKKLQFTKPSPKALSPKDSSPEVQPSGVPSSQSAPSQPLEPSSSDPSSTAVQKESTAQNPTTQTEEESFDPLPQDLVEEGETVDDLASPVENVSDPDADLELEIKQRIKSYTYDPILRKDPFTKPGVLDTTLSVSPEETIHPVEEESIESLKLKAIIWSSDGVIPRALFETSKGRSYTLSKNDRIGSQGSIIYRIDTNRVWFMKPFIDPVSKQLGYRPNEISLEREKNVSEELWYER